MTPGSNVASGAGGVVFQVPRVKSGICIGVEPASQLFSESSHTEHHEARS